MGLTKKILPLYRMTYRRSKISCWSGLIAVMALLSVQPSAMYGQVVDQPPPADASGASSVTPPAGEGLPENSELRPSGNTAAQASPADASANLSGVVLDMSGAAVAGADIGLLGADGVQQSAARSGANGEFTFTVPPGSYRVVVSAVNFETFQSPEIVLTAQQDYEMPKISLRVAPANTNLIVRPTDVVAAAQVKAQEQQRIIGIVPNFYTSYIYYAAPLTVKQKFGLVSRNAFDPIEFLATSIDAGISQGVHRFPGYGTGGEGYARRWGAAFADTFTRNYLSYAVFPSLFHQDPRYFYQGSGSDGSRLLHALSFTVMLRGDKGQTMPNYSFFLGSVGSALLSNAYYPREDRTARVMLINVGISVVSRAGVAVLREFVSKRYTTNVPGDGKPVASRETGQPSPTLP